MGLTPLCGPAAAAGEISPSSQINYQPCDWGTELSGKKSGGVQIKSIHSVLVHVCLFLLDLIIFKKCAEQSLDKKASLTS